MGRRQTDCRLRAGNGRVFLRPAAGAGTSANGTSAAPGRPFAKFVTLKGADHFYNTLMYDHQKTLYAAMLDFLRNDCGPGGL